MQPPRSVDRGSTRGPVAGRPRSSGAWPPRARGRGCPASEQEDPGRSDRLRQCFGGLPAAPLGLPVRRAGEYLRHHPRAGHAAAAKFNVPNHYPNIEAMLAGAPFDMMVTLTDMQEHGRLNSSPLLRGATSGARSRWRTLTPRAKALLELARHKGVRIWGAPAVVTSPQFAVMARPSATDPWPLAAAHATYGHLGPDWSAFFYEKLGGSMPDLGVYNLTTLTGVLGPAKAVVALTGIITPTRTVENKGKIKVEAEDNTMVLLDHGHGTFSHVQCGFNYFDPHGHDGSELERHSISIVGKQGLIELVGYDWAPHGVDIATMAQPHAQAGLHRVARLGLGAGSGRRRRMPCDRQGAADHPRARPAHRRDHAKPPAASGEHGRRVELQSSFKWPLGVSRADRAPSGRKAHAVVPNRECEPPGERDGGRARSEARPGGGKIQDRSAGASHSRDRFSSKMRGDPIANDARVISC